MFNIIIKKRNYSKKLCISKNPWYASVYMAVTIVMNYLLEYHLQLVQQFDISDKLYYHFFFQLLSLV